MASIRRSLIWSFAGRYSTLTISVISTMILARLLTPEEIGIFSVGYAVLVLGHALRDFGVTGYLIQEHTLTRDRIRSAFGVTMFFAWTMAGVIFATSDAVSEFYGEPGLKDVLNILCITFLLLPFNSPVVALFRRDLAFDKIYRINVARALANSATSIILASHGFGFASLAWASVAGTVTVLILVSIMRPKDTWMLPGWKECRRVFAFGGRTSAAALITEVGNSAPDFVIGRVIGFDALGLFSRARGLFELFNRSVMMGIIRVVMPAFARKDRAGEDVLHIYLTGLCYITVLAWPFFIFVGFMAFPIVRFMFGDQWDAAVPLIQIMCFGGILLPFNTLARPTLLALGAATHNLRVHSIVQPVTVLVVIGAAYHSLEAVALQVPVMAAFMFVVSFKYVRMHIGISPHGIWNAVSKSAGVAIVSGIVPGLVYMAMNTYTVSVWLVLPISAIVTGCVWLGSLLLLRHPFRKEIALLWSKLNELREYRV